MRTISVIKVSGLVLAIGIIDLFDALKRVAATGWGQAAGLLFLLAVVIGCNHVAAPLAPDYLLPVQFAGSADLLTAAVLILVPLPLFVMAEFSFGYLVGLSAYVTVAGYIVFSYASPLAYNHADARLSVGGSLITFLLPALFLRRRKSFAISERAVEWLLNGALVIAFVVIGADASYGFRIAGFEASMQARSEVVRPTLLNYASDMLTCSVLPFTLAWAIDRKRWYLVIVTPLVMMAFFPMLLSKIVLFSPVWVIFLYLLFSVGSPKSSAIMAITWPLLLTAMLYLWFDLSALFFIVDVRMIATPSIAIDRYLAFFADHPLTHFCQINVVRHLTGCPYSEQLGVIMKQVYPNEGNFNASLFATEGIASVGPFLAPIATFFCGIVIAAGNIASSRLSPALLAASSGVFLNVLMNVPLSASMLSDGGFLLFALWFLTKE
jgi:hypothetical protein